MRFDLEHDWQGNMSTPRARVGESAKTRLLILLCAIWLCLGLVGHSPWKPYEAQSISIIKTILETGNWIAPLPASSNQLVNPPLYYITAAFTAKIFGGMFDMDDAARLATGLWMTITLLLIGMTGRELWGKDYGRQTTFVFVGSLGLVISAHTLMPAVSALAALSGYFYGLALAKRRPYRASLILGVSLGMGFLSTGLIPVVMMISTTAILMLIFKNWRTLSFYKVTALAVAISSPMLLIWPIICHFEYPRLLNQWWLQSLNQFNHHHFTYYINILLWYAWPALPIALWGFWRFRAELFRQERFQLILTFLVVTWIVISVAGEDREVYALPLLIPLTAMAGGSIETLKRGASGALSWFGVILFGLMICLIWTGWIALLTGSPVKMKERIVFLSGLTHLNLQPVPILLAVLMTIIWQLTVFRSKSTNRASGTNWALGTTCVWTLLMTLWLPMIDNARSYEQTFSDLKHALPAHYACITSNHVGGPQRDLLHYYANVKTLEFETTQRLDCDLYLIQDTRGIRKIEPGPDWKLIWHGKRTHERRESFRLYKHI
jgi:4-amino-4-deoxy-L-arabinose transferase-like glycosyltransferase